MKVAIMTLGCKVNQFETQAMEAELLRGGHELGEFDGVNDAYVINSCSVTAASDKKTRQAVRRARRLNPDAVIGVCGCYSQTRPEELKKLEIDVIGGTADRLRFLELLERASLERSQILGSVDEPFLRTNFEVLPSGGMQNRTRALLKVQDGCGNFCAYCIIPYARGPVRSLPFERALSEAARLEAEGFKELVITGIEISSYGADLGGAGLKELVAAICEAAPNTRIRLGSLEPRTVDEDFCLTLKGKKNLCPHFHLSLQSGCDETLRRMGRRYDTAGYYQSLSLLKEYFPGCALTTDLIVGFPGETEEEFAAGCDFVRKCGFASIHVFPYSRREGTAAARMEGQLSRAVKERRAKTAGRLASELRLAYNRSLVGKKLEVLFETEREGLFSGHGENYVQVRAEGEIQCGRVYAVSVTEAGEDFVQGRLL